MRFRIRCGNLLAPAKPALAAPMVQRGSHEGASRAGARRTARGQAPDETQTCPATSAETGRRTDDLSWILYPGLYPGGLDVSNGATAYLMPGIYWIGGGGSNPGRRRSIVAVGNESDAKPDASTAPCAGRRPRAASAGA